MYEVCNSILCYCLDCLEVFCLLINYLKMLNQICYGGTETEFSFQFPCICFQNSKSLKLVIFWCWSLKKSWRSEIDEQLLLMEIVKFLHRIKRKRGRKKLRRTWTVTPATACLPRHRHATFGRLSRMDARPLKGPNG